MGAIPADRTGPPDDDVVIAAWVAAADLVVLPSLYEGLPNVVLEAMRFRKPVVATAAPGTTEVVADGATGLLVPLRNPPALAQAIRTVLQDPDLARTLGDAGRARVESEFRADTMVTRFAESAAPSYPPKLLEMKVEGGAYVQFVVDTTGLADTTSFRVISATHPEFAQSVRDALPGMRFSPAILRSKKVRQLVEQPFMFKIVPAAPTTPTQPVASSKP